MSCPIPKLKRDWIGRRVRTLRKLQSRGGSIIKKGRVVVIKGYYRGMKLSTLRAPHACITRCHISDVEFLPLSRAQAHNPKIEPSKKTA